MRTRCGDLKARMSVILQGSSTTASRGEWCRGLRKWVAQHGHRSRLWARATVSLRRMVAIEFGTCRSGRIGGAAGSITGGKVHRLELRAGRSGGGNPHPFGDQEAIGGGAQTGMGVEAAPAPAPGMPAAPFLVELLVVPVRAP